MGEPKIGLNDANGSQEKTFTRAGRLQEGSLPRDRDSKKKPDEKSRKRNLNESREKVARRGRSARKRRQKKTKGSRGTLSRARSRSKAPRGGGSHSSGVARNPKRCRKGSQKPYGKLKSRSSSSRTGGGRSGRPQALRGKPGSVTALEQKRRKRPCSFLQKLREKELGIKRGVGGKLRRLFLKATEPGERAATL